MARDHCELRDRAAVWPCAVSDTGRSDFKRLDAVPIRDRRHRYPHASRLRNVRAAIGEYFGGIRAQNGKPFGVIRYRDWRLRSCSSCASVFSRWEDGRTSSLSGPRARAGSRRDRVRTSRRTNSAFSKCLDECNAIVKIIILDQIKVSGNNGAK